MSFENDYNAFLKSIQLENYSKSEEIISECDRKIEFLKRALNDCGSVRIKKAVNNFRSKGLKKSLEEVLEKHKEINYEDKYINQNRKKIILSHHDNRIKNKLYHLSGSSFPHESTTKDELEFLMNTINRKASA